MMKDTILLKNEEKYFLKNKKKIVLFFFDFFSYTIKSSKLYNPLVDSQQVFQRIFLFVKAQQKITSKSFFYNVNYAFFTTHFFTNII